MSKKVLSLVLAMLMLLSTFATLNISVFAGTVKTDYETDPVDVLNEGWNYDSENDEWCYVLNGKLYGGWLSVKGVWYYLDPDSYIMEANSVREINGEYYYFAKSGAMAKSGWVKDTRYEDYSWEINGKYYYDWFYASSSGALLKGWQKINNVWYFFENGEDSTPYMFWGDCYNINGVIYIFDLNGKWISAPGWQSIKWNDYTDWFYLDNAGKCRTNSWLLYKGSWYYFNDWGYMISENTYEIKDQIYAFNKNGTLHEKKGWFGVRDYYYNDKDERVYYYNWYYTKADGTCYTGWVRVNGTWYYFGDEDAIMYSIGWFKIGDSYHYFDESGAWVKESVPT